MNNLYGTFRVTTEGDCEGRTTKDLGVFTGFIDEIAFHLANKVFYQLIFQRIEIQTQLPPTDDSVSISIYPEMSLAEVKKMFKDREVDVELGQYYKSFKITKPLSEIEKKEIVRKKALKKLTEEERIALGLID